MCCISEIIKMERLQISTPISSLSLLAEQELIKWLDRRTLTEIIDIIKENRKYRDIIGEYIIPKMLVDLSQICKMIDIRQIMEEIGEFINEIRVKLFDNQYTINPSNSYIEELFELINTRCTVGRLSHITLDFDENFDKLEFSVVPNIFREITRLTIIGIQGTLEPSTVLKKLLPQCRELHDLSLYRVYEDYYFLMALTQLSVASLCIDNSKIAFNSWSNVNNIKALQAVYDLQFTNCVFELYPITEHIKEISFLGEDGSPFPNLHTFSFRSVCFISCQQPIHTVNVSFNAFRNIRSLKNVTIHHKNKDFRWHINIASVIKALAEGDSIESLSIYLNFGDEVPNEIRYFTNLYKVEFFEPSIGLVPQYAKFLKLPQITECTFASEDRLEETVLLLLAEECQHLERLNINSKETRIGAKFIQTFIEARNLPSRILPHLHLYAHIYDFNETFPEVTLHNLG